MLVPQPIIYVDGGADQRAAHTAAVTGVADAVSETRRTYDVIAWAHLERKRDRPWDDYLLDLLDRFFDRLPGRGAGHGPGLRARRADPRSAKTAHRAPSIFLLREDLCVCRRGVGCTDQHGTGRQRNKPVIFPVLRRGQVDVPLTRAGS